MASFDPPSRPSALAVRECARPRFDGDLRGFDAWLEGLKGAGVRQAGPALLLALESLRKSPVSANRRLSLLHALKLPVLKTCAGLPKPSTLGTAQGAPVVTLEQRIDALMFSTLLQALRQLDHDHKTLTPRQQQMRDWAIRNLFRFFNRQTHYVALWRTPWPEHCWRELHELYLHLQQRPLGTLLESWEQVDTATSVDADLEYKRILLFALAAEVNPPVTRTQGFNDALDIWAGQSRLEDAHGLRGRAKLFVVDISHNGPPYQIPGTLDRTLEGWVLQPPYAFLHTLTAEDGEVAQSTSPPNLGLTL